MYEPGDVNEKPRSETAKVDTEAEHALLDRKDSRTRSHTVLVWWPELACIVLAFAALLALFATLYTYADKPSPDWPTWLSINTVVSIYVVLLKTCVLVITASGLGQLKWEWFAGRRARPLADLVEFDSASRGPLGAVSLLWRTKLSHALSSIGAIIVILALATEPFAQQIVRYYECAVQKAGAQAHIPRTNYYDGAGGEHIGAMTGPLFPEVQNAILGGIFNPSPNPATQCAGGNCTFHEQYSSIAYCSACKDISDDIKFKNVTWTYMYEDTSIHTWNLTSVLPSGLNVTMSPVSAEARTYQVAAMGDLGAEFIIGKTSVHDQPNVNGQTGLPWPDCNSAVSNKTDWKCRGYGASSCRLYPCIKTYSATVESGVLRENIVDISDSWGYAARPAPDWSPPMASLDTHCINAYEWRSLEELGYQLHADERWLAYNSTFSPLTAWWRNDTFPNSMIKRGCLYMVGALSTNSIEAWLQQQLFSGSVDIMLADEDDAIIGYAGPQVIQSMYNFGDVSFDRIQATFDNISIALTNYFRQNGIANFSTAATGIALEEKTCISVRWPWLIYPTVLVCMALVFLMLLVLGPHSGGERREVWKSSPLALYYYGLIDEDGNTQLRSGGSVRSCKNMSDYAKNTSARLTSTTGDVARLEIQNR